MLSSEQIKTFQVLFERRFGRWISEEEARELATRLVMLVKLTQCPSSEDQKDVAQTDEPPEVEST